MKKRSKFNLSYQRLMSCKLGFLIPIGLTEVLPGDSFCNSTSVFMQFQPMLAPVMCILLMLLFIIGMFLIV